VYDGTTGLPDAQGDFISPTAYYGTGLGIGDIDNDGEVEVVRADYYGIDIFNGKTSVTDYGSYLGWVADSIIISRAKDPRVFGEASFIRFSENAVSVPPNAFHNVTVTFDATKLNKGNYNATIVINSNDPDENPVEVPVNLRVITPPHITSFSPANLTPTQLENTTYFQITKYCKWYLYMVCTTHRSRN